MVTFDATAEPLAAPPRVRLDLDTEDPASIFTAISISRNGVALRNQPDPGGAEAVVFDYDAPYGVTLDYLAEGRYLPAATADWTESWASLAAWTGDTADYSVSGGKARSSVTSADISRSASGAIERLGVTDPSFVRIELLTAGDVLVGSVESGDQRVTVTGTAAVQVVGSGTYTITLTGGDMLVSGSGWSAEVPFTGVPTKVRIVGLGISYAAYGFFSTGGLSFTGLAMDGSNNFYVGTGEWGDPPASRRIRRFDASGTQTLEFNPTGTPRAIDVDAAGNMYVADTSGSLVRKFDSTGVQTLSFSTTGTPTGIAVDGSGNIYVADDTSNLIRKYNSSGVAGITFSTVGNPTDVEVDGAGNIYVADATAKKIRKFNAAGAQTLEFSTTNAPEAVAVDAAGLIYVADQTGSLVRKYSAAGSLLTSFASPQPRGVALDTAENVFTYEYFWGTVRGYTKTTPSVGAIAATLAVAEIGFLAIAEATLDVDTGWLIHPVTPDLSVQIDGGPDGPCCGPGCSDDNPGLLYLDPATEGTVAYAASATVHQIVGSNLPVVVSSGRRKAGTWTLIVQSCDNTGRDALLALLDDQQPVLLNLPDAWGYDLPLGWFAVGDVDESRLTNQNMLLPQRVLSLPMQPVAEPSLTSSLGHTWGDLLTENLTWQGVLDTYGSWLGVLLGEPA